MDVEMPDGTVITDVPEGTTKAQLLQKLQGGKQQELKPWFRGRSMAFPEEITKEQAEWPAKFARGAFADAASAPFQMGAGWADVGGEAANKMGLPGSNDSRMSPVVSKYRNMLAGREGIEPAPTTGIVQGLATAPLSPLLQLGLFPGLARQDQSPSVELGKGAVANLALMGTAKMLTKGKAPSLAEERIQNVASREGVDTMFGTHTGQDVMKNVERRAERNFWLGGITGHNYAQKVREGIDNDFTRALWRHAGMTDDVAGMSGRNLKFDEFTPDHFNFAAKSIGAKLEQPFAGKEMVFRSPSLNITVKKAQIDAKNMTEPDQLIKAIDVVTARINKGKIDSSEFNVMVDDLRFLAKKAFDDGNKNAGDRINELMTAVRSQAVSNIPTQSGKEAYLKAVKEWANLKVLEDLFKRSSGSARGNVDPWKLKASIERSMPGGYVRGRADLADLSTLGEAMKPSDVLPEGMKWNPIEPAMFALFNNPVSRAVRRSDNPLPYDETSALLRALGIGAGQN